jgi:hypothetical protein
LFGPQHLGDFVALVGSVLVSGLGDEREPFVGFLEVLFAVPSAPIASSTARLCIALAFPCWAAI